MKYYAIYMEEQEQSNRIETRREVYNAACAGDVHALATPTDGETVRVYPALDSDVGIMAGALLVARRTALNAMLRTTRGVSVAEQAERQAARAAQATDGKQRTRRTPEQIAVDEMRHIQAMTHSSVENRVARMAGELSAANVRAHGANSGERINAIIADYSHDAQDYYSAALVGLYDGIAEHGAQNVVECYHAAYLALNRYAAAQRTHDARTVSTEYIIDGGGALVSYNDAVACIIKGGDSWTPVPTDKMSESALSRLAVLISEFFDALNARQRPIARYLADGYAQGEIASMLNLSAGTVKEHIANIRVKAAEVFAGTEFSDILNIQGIARSIEEAKAEKKRRAAERDAEDAHRKEERKRKAAERARAYRERQKAAQAAQAAQA